MICHLCESGASAKCSACSRYMCKRHTHEGLVCSDCKRHRDEVLLSIEHQIERNQVQRKVLRGDDVRDGKAEDMPAVDAARALRPWVAGAITYLRRLGEWKEAFEVRDRTNERFDAGKYGMAPTQSATDPSARSDTESPNNRQLSHGVVPASWIRL
jgi:hypothetical protein